MDQQNPNPYLSQMNLNMQLFNNLASMEGFNTNIHGIMPLSHEGFSDHHHSQLQNASIFDPTAHFFPSSNIVNMAMEPEIQVNSSPSASGNGFHGADRVKKKHQLQNCGGKKRKRISERDMEKPREVVHVRAKRGQATDSHSLAERLRREKINEKLKCLRDLVPGCYKTMGMAVMLDVIINYLRSLQNQIDFLSMKLSAASLFISSEAEAMETIQGTTGFQEQGIEKLMGNGFGENSQFQTPWPL